MLSSVISSFEMHQLFVMFNVNQNSCLLFRLMVVAVVQGGKALATGLELCSIANRLKMPYSTQHPGVEMTYG